MSPTTMILLCGLTLSPPADGRARSAHVRTAAGRLHEGTILSWRPSENLVLRTSNGTNVQVPSQDVDQITLSPKAEQPPHGTWIIEMRNDGRLSGDIAGGDDARLLMRHALLNQVELPLDQLISIRRMRQRLAGPQPPTTERKDQPDSDSVLLANRDLMSGPVTAVRADGVSILSNDNEQALSWEVIEEVSFAAPADPVRPAAGLRLRFGDGSVILAKALDWENNSVKAELGEGRAIQFDSSILNLVEVIGGRRIWLTELVPADYRSIPFFDRPWPLRHQANALGGPLRLMGNEYPIGLGLHAACRITWKLDDSYERFTALIGVDDFADRWADADVTILVDRKPVASLKALRHKDPPREIDLDLHGASELTIEVGFGRYGDVQDRIDLVKPALIRSSPRRESMP